MMYNKWTYVNRLFYGRIHIFSQILQFLFKILPLADEKNGQHMYTVFHKRHSFFFLL